MSEPFSKGHRPDHPVTWRGKTYHISSVTTGVKQSFCDWLIRSMVSASARALGKDSQEFKEYRTELFASPPTWGVVPSPAVAAAFASTDGQLMMSRLLLNVGPADMDDETLLEMVGEKSEDPTSDFMVAMARVIEGADPKAGRGVAGSTPTTPTV